MNQITLKARAKINLTLDVTGKRDDGYHDVKMVMQTINLYDLIVLKKMKNEGIKLETNLKWLCSEEKNLAYKAAKLMVEKFDIKQGIFIDLYKMIPVAAGLAGGSTDAAAVMVGIRKLFSLNISDEELMTLGKELGADVPYCIMRGTALAEGIGEILTELPNCPKCHVVLAKPNINVSTPYIYKQLDLVEIKKHPDLDKMIKAITDKDIKALAGNMYNVMEEVTAKEYPIIKELEEFMLERGALGAVMSGSGPTVFGIFDDFEKAKNVYYRLKLENKAKDIFLTTMFEKYDINKSDYREEERKCLKKRD